MVFRDFGWVVGPLLMWGFVQLKLWGGGLFPSSNCHKDDYTAYGSYAGADGVKKPKKRSMPHALYTYHLRI